MVGLTPRFNPWARIPLPGARPLSWACSEQTRCGARTRYMDTRSQSLIIIDPPPEGEAEPNRLYVSLHAPLPPWASEANRTFIAEHWSP